jgi:hypothetical protein
MNCHHNIFHNKSTIILFTVFIFLCLNSCNKKEEHGGDTSTASSCSSESLLINEVSGAAYNNTMPWFEIYNNGSSCALMSNFSVKTLSISTSDNLNNLSDARTFSLPSVELKSGGYMIIRGKYTTSNNITSSASFAEISDDSSYSPAWGPNGGFIEILKDGKTIDFVSFGTDTTSPASSDAWSGSAASKPVFWSTYSKSIARDSTSTDTNSSSDWTQRTFGTFGGKNDVPASCTSDADSDGIPDCSEENSSSTFAGINLYSFGARTNQKDIFVEVDYMTSTDPGITPRKEALDKVKAVFAAQNYSIHFDVGDLIDGASGIDPDDYDLGGGNSFDYSACLSLRKKDGCGAYLDDVKYKNFDIARRTIFYYMLFGNSQNTDGSGGSSGRAEKPGNDSIVTIGSWNLNTNSTSNTNTLNNYMAGTVLHEFGHNLDLGHGGNSSINYKPNYLSSMNYMYQLDGLPPDNKTGDRYYFTNYKNNSDCGPIQDYSDLQSGPDTSGMVIGFSNGSGANLTESSQAESVGLGRTSPTKVDFNCDGDTDDTTNIDLNPKDDSGSNTSTDTLTDYNDWANITIVFNETYSGQTRSLRNFSESNYNNEVILHPIYDHLQPVAEEFDPPKSFFEELNRNLRLND